MKPFIYISSPYTKGDPAINTRFQCQVFDELMTDKLVLPYAPLWTHFQHTLFPRAYQDWISLELEMIPRFDACLRLNSEFAAMQYFQSESSGADLEEKTFKALGKPVFYNKTALYEWVKSR